MYNIPIKTNYTTQFDKFTPKDCLRKLKEMFWRTQKWEELEFTDKAWVKINAYCQLAGNLEITGFGKVEDNKITDIKILKQSGEGAEVNVDEEAQMIFMRSIPLEEMHLWVLDWHSHVDMSAFMSTTDTKNYDKRYDVMKSSFPALVMNKRQEVICREWFGDGLYSDKINITVPQSLQMSEEEFLEIYNKCYEDVENLLQTVTKVYTNSVKSSYNYGYKNNNLRYTDYSDDDWDNCDWDDELHGWVVNKDKSNIKLSKNKLKKLRKLKLRIKEKKEKLLKSNPSKCLACGDELGYEVEKKYHLCTACMNDEQLLECQESELNQNNIDYSTDRYEHLDLKCSICQQPIDYEDDEQVEYGMCGDCLLRYTQ